MKNILIIGASEFGKHLANFFIELHNEVMLVDKSQELVDELAHEYENILIADCRNKHAIEQLGVNHYDICVVAVGESFQDSLEITANLKESAAKYIISQCNSDIQAKFLMMAGADKTIFTEKEAAEKVANLYNDDKTLDYISLNEDYIIVKIKVPAKWIGYTLPELDLRNKYHINVLAVESYNQFSLPGVSSKFEKDNLVMILGSRDSIAKFLKR